MVMTVEHHVRPILIKRLPKRLRAGIVAVLAGAEARLMPISQGTHALIGNQVSPQPLLLRGTGIVGDLAVEGDDVPGTQVVGVIPLRWVACRRTKVAEITGCSSGMV